MTHLTADQLSDQLKATFAKAHEEGLSYARDGEGHGWTLFRGRWIQTERAPSKLIHGGYNKTI